MSDWIHYISWIKELWYFWLFGIVGVGILAEFVDGKPHPIFRTLKMLAFGIITISWILGMLSLLWWLSDWALSLLSHFLGSGSATPWSFSTWYHSLGWLGKWWLYYGIAEVLLLCAAILASMRPSRSGGVEPAIIWTIWSFIFFVLMVVISAFGGVIGAIFK